MSYGGRLLHYQQQGQDDTNFFLHGASLTTEHNTELREAVKSVTQTIHVPIKSKSCDQCPEIAGTVFNQDIHTTTTTKKAKQNCCWWSIQSKHTTQTSREAKHSRLLHPHTPELRQPSIKCRHKALVQTPAGGVTSKLGAVHNQSQPKLVEPTNGLWTLNLVDCCVVLPTNQNRLPATNTGVFECR